MFERRNYEETIKRLQEERNRFEELYEKARTAQAIWKMQVRQEKTQGEPAILKEKEKGVPEKRPAKRIPWIFSSCKEFRKNRDAGECRRIFMEAMQKNKYSDKHLQILAYAFTNGFTVEEMKYLTEPGMETNNAVILCALFAKRKGMESPFTMDGIPEVDGAENIPLETVTGDRQENVRADEGVYTEEPLDGVVEDDEVFEDAP